MNVKTLSLAALVAVMAGTLVLSGCKKSESESAAPGSETTPPAATDNTSPDAGKAADEAKADQAKADANNEAAKADQAKADANKDAAKADQAKTDANKEAPKQ